MAHLKSCLCVEGFTFKIHKIGHSQLLLGAQISTANEFGVDFQGI